MCLQLSAHARGHVLPFLFGPINEHPVDRRIDPPRRDRIERDCAVAPRRAVRATMAAHPHRTRGDSVPDPLVVRNRSAGLRRYVSTCDRSLPQRSRGDLQRFGGELGPQREWLDR